MLNKTKYLVIVHKHCNIRDRVEKKFFKLKRAKQYLENRKEDLSTEHISILQVRLNVDDVFTSNKSNIFTSPKRADKKLCWRLGDYKLEFDSRMLKY